MTPRDARLVLGWETGTPTEQHVLAAIRSAAWPDLQRLAAGWPDLVSAYLLLADQPGHLRSIARRA